MPKTLLLADDSVTIQKVVGITFANEDVELVTVDNGDDGLVRARQIRPDLVLADVSMPGLTGYELCAAIRADADLASVPVLLLTGTFETYDAQRASECGADGYIAKPFEAQALIERVRSLLERPRAARPKPAPAAEFDAPPAAAVTPARVSRPAPAEAPTAGRTQQPPIARPTPATSPSAPAAPRTSPPGAPPGAPARAPAAAPAPARPQAPPAAPPAAARPPAPAAPPPAAPRPPAAPQPPRAPAHTAPASLSLNRGVPPARPVVSSTPAQDALDEIPEEPLTVHTPPRALHPEGIPRGATATRVMPPAALSDDALFGEPEEDTNTTAPERAPLLAEDDGGFEIEHPVRFNEPAEQSDDGSRSYGELGQSFSISRETLTEPAPEEATPPRVRSAPAPAPSLAADDDSDLPWAEPIDLDQESDGDSGDDSIEAAKFAERLPPLPPPARAEPPSRPEPRAEVRFAEESPRRAAPTAPALDPRVVHESLEKVAWEAFGPLSEQIMQEVVKRVEAIAWEVVPQLAERLIREEIAQLKKSE